MASITKRGGSWVACWKQGGLTVKRATGIKVAEPGMSPRQAEALARQTAQMMEAASKGQTPCQKAVAAVRAAAVAFGAAQHVPTVREFLAAVPVTAGASASTFPADSYPAAYATFSVETWELLAPLQAGATHASSLNSYIQNAEPNFLF